MTETAYSYRDVLAVSQNIRWVVDDLIGNGKHLDFTLPFMPESLAWTHMLPFLNEGERVTLNQIRGNTYLCLFGVVEEFILPFVMDHVRSLLNQDNYQIQALLHFAAEEAKHIHLFKKFKQDFERGFGMNCSIIGPPDAIAKEILAHHPLAVALVILQTEWVTQLHYTESIHDNDRLDPQFSSLLKHHWMEEAQHAKLDTLMVEALAAECSPEEIVRAFEEYVEIGNFLDAGLKQQTEFDLASFEQATGRILTSAEREQFLKVQHQANRWTYLGSGMRHPNFLKTLDKISPASGRQVRELAVLFS
ncbi:MAG: hypothetical protein K1Y36_29045 [Blastocatellia bacterium]|nr:hypothetical protein [Blastocatellia bacterium]